MSKAKYNHHNCVWLHLRNENELAVLYKILRAFNTNLKVLEIVYSHSKTMPYHPIVYLRPPEFTDEAPKYKPIGGKKWSRIQRLMALSRKIDQDALNEQIERQVFYQDFDDGRTEWYLKHLQELRDQKG